jgi:hypothetical protein
MREGERQWLAGLKAPGTTDLAETTPDQDEGVLEEGIGREGERVLTCSSGAAAAAAATSRGGRGYRRNPRAEGEVAARGLG